MGRPVYPYELGDPDFSWLISNFQENNPHYTYVESSCLPVVFIKKGTLEQVGQFGEGERALVPKPEVPPDVLPEDRNK